MNKKISLLLALIITLSVYFFFSFSHNSNLPREKVIMGRVIDGDTLVLNDGRTLRLLNINAPEKNTPLSKQSLALVKLLENQSIEIEITGKDNYNRYLSRVYTPEYLNLKLISLGLASKFLVQDNELNLFANAEKQAIEQSKGIWNKSIYYNCFSSSIDKKNEKVIIKNNCQAINLSGWLLKDESRKEYAFSTIITDEIILYSGVGADNNNILHWNQKTNVWNDDRDSLYLFDNNNNLAHYHTYGY
jgi:endonuclease YncB( thermonuclease family)